MNPSLLAILLAAAPPVEGTVVLRGDTHARLRPDPERDPGPWVRSRTLILRPREGGVEIEARYQLRTRAPGFWGGRVAGPGIQVREVRWNGQRADSWQDDGTAVWGRVNGRATLEIRGFVPGDPARGQVDLQLLDAVSGTVRVEGAGAGSLELRSEGVEVLRRGERHLTGAGRLSLGPAPPPGDRRGRLVMGRAALGLTVGDGILQGKAHVQWLPRRGTVETVVARVAGVGEDLQVEGPAVARWERKGDRVIIELARPAADLVDVTATWTEALPAGEAAQIAAPVFVPEDVFRVERVIQLARAGEVDVAPELGEWTAISARELPPWGTGLVEGQPTAAFRITRSAGAPPGLSLFRFVPVEGPAVVVDVADHLVAATAEGRLLARTRLEVRNERASHLRLHLPAGAELVGASVNNERVRAARDDDGALLIPLPRSVETVDGLLTFPVVVAILGHGDVWARRDRRDLDLLRVDAPVNVSRTTLHLPPGHRSRLEPGEHDIVPAFTRGEHVAYGGLSEQQAAQADALFRDAVEAWNENEFGRAQERLDDLRSMDATGKNVEQLQSNVDLMRVVPTDDGAKVSMGASSPAPAPEPVAAESISTVRRIKAQVRARAGKLRTRQRKAKKKARELRASGRYEEAKQEYRSAVEATRQLDKIEDEESATYDFEADELEGELEVLEEEAANRSALEGEADGGEDGWAFIGGEMPTPDLHPRFLDGPLVVIPTAGEAVRYQHLLLESGAHRALHVETRKIRSRK